MTNPSPNIAAKDTEGFIPQESVVATDPAHLQTLIRQSLHANGDGSDLNHIDVSGITDFSETFRAFPMFNGDISRWNVSNAETMASMFNGCLFYGDISSWAVSKVINMEDMFRYSTFNGDISRWDVSRVRNMRGMFNGSKFNQSIGNWDVSSVHNFGMMFAQSCFDQPLFKWNTSNARDMLMMFGASEFNQDISSWNVSRVHRVLHMFSKSNFAQDISAWNLPPHLKDEDLLDIDKINPHFLSAQSLSPWVIRLHLLKKMTPSDPVWAQAFTTTAPIAEGLGLPWQDHVSAIEAEHANLMGKAPVMDVASNAPIDANLFA